VKSSKRSSKADTDARKLQGANLQSALQRARAAVLSSSSSERILVTLVIPTIHKWSTSAAAHVPTAVSEPIGACETMVMNRAFTSAYEQQLALARVAVKHEPHVEALMTPLVALLEVAFYLGLDRAARARQSVQSLLQTMAPTVTATDANANGSVVNASVVKSFQKLLLRLSHPVLLLPQHVITHVLVPYLSMDDLSRLCEVDTVFYRELQRDEIWTPRLERIMPLLSEASFRACTADYGAGCPFQRLVRPHDNNHLPRLPAMSSVCHTVARMIAFVQHLCMIYTCEYCNQPQLYGARHNECWFHPRALECYPNDSKMHYGCCKGSAGSKGCTARHHVLPDRPICSEHSLWVPGFTVPRDPVEAVGLRRTNPCSAHAVHWFEQHDHTTPPPASTDWPSWHSGVMCLCKVVLHFTRTCYRTLIWIHFIVIYRSFPRNA